jgi:hypothetical protein
MQARQNLKSKSRPMHKKSFEHFVESKMLGVYYSASVIRNTHRNATESVITLNVLYHHSAAEQARNQIHIPWAIIQMDCSSESMWISCLHE